MASKGLSVGGLLLFGTTTSLFAKIAYELRGEGLDGTEKHFTKPWAMTTVMFLGMSFCLPIAYIQNWLDRKRQKSKAALRDAETPLLEGSEEILPLTLGGWRQTAMLALPTMFDLIATVLMNVGLLSVTASVYQMMRGAEMLFAAIFAVAFLKRHLNRFHYGGILCCVSGITMVGLSSLQSGEGSATKAVSQEEMLLGMGLIIASQAVQAAQITLEDVFMSDLNIAPLVIVGYEGVVGGLMMVCVMLPIVYFLPGGDGLGIHENSLDTLHMIAHSKSIPIVLLVDMFALLSYNYAGMCVTGHLGAVYRTVLETMRTLFVWLVDLALFYGGVGLGESWSNWSFLQAAGFVVLVAGTLIYGKGDDEACRKEIGGDTEMVKEESALPPRPPNARIPTAPTPIGAPAQQQTEPIAMRQTPSSYKSTMNISAHSYGARSLQGSYSHLNRHSRH